MDDNNVSQIESNGVNVGKTEMLTPEMLNAISFKLFDAMWAHGKVSGIPKNVNHYGNNRYKMPHDKRRKIAKMAKIARRANRK